jgi:hypothetical protein
MSRSPWTRERLGRLRAELGKIDEPACSPEEARRKILDAMARAGLVGWTVPELFNDTVHRYADGSLRIGLLAHAIIFNPWGAFRIEDVHFPSVAYFELSGCRERGFVAPRDDETPLQLRRHSRVE